jgi:hypothetical protein
VSRRTRSRALPAAAWAATAFLVLGSFLTISATAVAASADVLSASLDSEGHLSLNATVVVANGSALRYAMDGNFTPLVNSMPVNGSTRASILTRIQAAEANPLFAPYFGNRDGTVDPVEVSLFAYLVEQGAKLVPTGVLSVTSAFGVRLDGNGPSSATLESVAFQGAPGPDGSAAPIVIQSGASFVFSYSSGSHTLSVVWSTVTAASSSSLGTVSVTFRTPVGEAVTHTSGLASASVDNDPFGWGSATVAGSASLLTPGNVTVAFAPAFPLGYVLIGVAVAAIAIAGVVVLRRRRRTRRRSTAPEADRGVRSGEVESERRSGSE